MKKIISIILFLAMNLSLAFAGTVNLNTATQSELEALPGIGAKVAKDIVAARPFASVDDLKKVKGIGDGKKFEKLKELVTTSGDVKAETTKTVTTTTTAATAATNTGMNTATTAVEKKVTVAKSANTKLAPGQKINLNTATKEDIEKLPGIGEKKAEAIISSRPFANPEDIMKVKGIKQGIYNKIKDSITVQ